MIRKYLDLSTAHLTQATADSLWSGADAPLTVWPDPHPHDGASCFVYVPDNGAAGVDSCPPDLARCLDLARSLGCDRICFDRDGDKHEALPVHTDGDDDDTFLSVFYNGRAIIWTWGDQRAAVSAGWFMGEDGALVRDDEAGVFANDAAAHDHVQIVATAGDEHAIRAMILNNLSGADAWVARLPGEEG